MALPCRGLRVDRAGTLRGYRGGTGGPGRWSPGSCGSEPGSSSSIRGSDTLGDSILASGRYKKWVEEVGVG